MVKILEFHKIYKKNYVKLILGEVIKYQGNYQTLRCQEIDQSMNMVEHG